MILYFFLEVECIGNTQIIHMEETGITQQTIGLILILTSNFRVGRGSKKDHDNWTLQGKNCHDMVGR